MINELKSIYRINSQIPDDYDLMFKPVFQECEVGLIVVDEQCRVYIWNQWISVHSGIALERIQGKKLIEVFPELENSRLKIGCDAAINHGMSSVISQKLNRKPLHLKNLSGHQIFQHIIIKSIPVANSQRFALIQINDVTAAVSREKQQQDQFKKTQVLAENLAQEKERAQVTLEAIADAVITTDSDGKILSMNPIAELLTNVCEQNALSHSACDVFQLINEIDDQAIKCPVTECLEKLQVISNDQDHVLVNSVGRKFAITDSVAPIMDANSNLLGAVLVFRDVSESREMAAELSWQAKHDPLTGLANRRAFEERMKQLLESARIIDQEHYLLYLDLDQFKVVNDTCGHDAGDELLKQVAVILQQQLRRTDLLARLGGDEFGVLLECCNSSHTYRIANNLRIAIQDFRFGWETHSFKVGVSIGIAKIRGTENKASEMLSNADAACYIAKQQGRNRVHFHEQETSESSMHQKEMQWISRIQSALDDDRFTLYVQRIQNTRQMQQPSSHYEVLLRMIDNDDTLIPPGAFLPAAERFNLMPSLDKWVINKVFFYLRNQPLSQGLSETPNFSINLSGVTLMDESVLEYIIQSLDETPLIAESICFEVTETAAIANLSTATYFLNKLREKGCKIALDDFGSGLSSFAYLKTMPVDYLKIDGHFVKDIADDPIDRAFVESINQIGKVMGLETIAEFVENNEILEVLLDLGVDYAQGYGVHKPCHFDSLF